MANSRFAELKRGDIVRVQQSNPVRREYEAVVDHKNSINQPYVIPLTGNITGLQPKYLWDETFQILLPEQMEEPLFRGYKEWQSRQKD